MAVGEQRLDSWAGCGTIPAKPDMAMVMAERGRMLGEPLGVHGNAAMRAVHAARVRDPAAAAALVRCGGQLRRLSPGTTLVAQGDDAPVLVVVQGALRRAHVMADGRRFILDFPQGGDLALPTSGRAYGVEAVGAAEVVCLAAARVEAEADRCGALARFLFGVSAAALLEAQERALMLGRFSATERLAWFVARAARRHAPGVPVCLPMAQADLADHLGLTTETVCRIMLRLVRGGIVRTPARHLVEVVDAARLAALASGAPDPGAVAARAA